MRSPKFVFSGPSISSCVSEKHLTDAWRKKVKSQLRKQLLFDLIEFRDIDHDISELTLQVAKEVLCAEYLVSKPRTYLVEKSRGLCRQMTLVQPIDLIVLQCLSTRLHNQIVKKSPSKAAFFQPGDMKWSSGKMTIGESDYGSVASWKRFQKQVLKFSRENKFIVVTDVANFYDFINFKHLRNIVASLSDDIDETVLDLLIHLLNELAWVPDYMPRQEMGMPQIEAEAPRVLANAMLFELDKVVEEKALKNYARFMDDIDFGTHSTIEARQMVRDIDLTLQSRQLRLNSAKTKIMTQEVAYKHFCVGENNRLDRYSNLMEVTKFWSILKPKVGKKINQYYEKWLDRTSTNGPSDQSIFLQGNGSKVHKRMLTLLRKCAIEPPIYDLIWLVKNDPGMRSVAFRHLMHTTKANTVFNALKPILLRGTFVDDQAHIEVASFCAHARFKMTSKLMSGLAEVCEYLGKQGVIGLYSATLIKGRYATPGQLLDHAQTTYSVWRKDYWLGRAISGLYPRAFVGGSSGSDYLRLIQRTNNTAAQDVVNYHHRLMNDAAFVTKCKSYLQHDNETFPQRIFFPKALQILSVKQNAAVGTLYNAIKAKHPAISADPFFGKWDF